VVEKAAAVVPVLVFDSRQVDEVIKMEAVVITQELEET
jgi:hypothetical protein